MLLDKTMIDLINHLQLKNNLLKLRKFQSEDIPIELAQDTNPEIMQYVRDILPEEEALNRAQSIAKKWSGLEDEWIGFSLRTLKEDRMMGMLSFKITSMEYAIVEIGYRIHPDFQNQGFVTAAASLLLNFLFNELKVHKVVATCVPENMASWKVMEKIGLKAEGHFKEHSKIGGIWYDELYYGLVAQDYSALCSSMDI